MVTVIKIPQVLRSRVAQSLEAIAAGVGIRHSVLETMQARVQAAASSPHLAERWKQIESVDADEVAVTYFSVFLRRSLQGHDPAIDLVSATYKQSMHLTNLTVVTSSTYYLNGSVQTDITMAQTHITGKDLEQFQIAWKYAVDCAVLRRSLMAISPTHAASVVNASPASGALRSCFSPQLSPIGLFSMGAAFTGLKKIILNAATLWQTVVSGFGTHQRKYRLFRNMASAR